MATGIIPADLAIKKVTKYYNAQSGDVIDTMTDGSATVTLSASLNASLYAVLNDTFAHVIQIFYGAAEATRPRVQMAFPYHTGINKMAWRNYSNGVWSAWHVIEQTE